MPQGVASVRYVPNSYPAFWPSQPMGSACPVNKSHPTCCIAITYPFDWQILIKVVLEGKIDARIVWAMYVNASRVAYINYPHATIELRCCIMRDAGSRIHSALFELFIYKISKEQKRHTSAFWARDGRICSTLMSKDRRMTTYSACFP